MVTEITLGSNSPISMDEMPVRNRQSPDNNSLNETTSSDTSATIASTSSPPQAPASQPTDRLIIAESVNTTDRYERRDLMDVLLVERMRVTNTDFGLFLLSIVLYLWDVASDIVLAINHYLNQNYWYFGLTLTFILLPSLVLMVIMRRWYNYLYEYQPPGNQPPTLPIQPTTACERHTLTACLWLQLGPMYRRIDILVHAHKSRQLTRSWEDRAEQFKCYSYKKRELNRSQIIETFMEAAPQLVLQLYIVAMSSTRNIGVLTCVSILGSLFALSISIVSYERMRLWYFNGSTWSLAEYIANYLWRLFAIGARVLAISLFASVFPIHLAVVCCLHYLAMFVWTVYVMGDIDGKNRASRIASAPPETTPDWPPINWPDIPEPIGESQSVPAPRGDQENPDDYRDRIIQSARKRFYKELRNSAGLAFVFIFCYHNPDGKLVGQRMIYYTILFIENCVLMAVWYTYCPDDRWYKSIALYTHFGCFFLGLTVMSVYNLWVRSVSNTVTNDNSIVSPQLPNGVQSGQMNAPEVAITL